MKFSIKNRFTGRPITEVELDAGYESKSYSVQLGGAVKIAVTKNMNLADANLAGAKLAGSNLSGANLARANLANSDLANSDLAGADLVGADLANSNLADSNLTNSNLARANLAGADLTRVNLAVVGLGEKGILQINGLRWPVLITPEYMKIGCEKHLHYDWRFFNDRRIAQMDGKKALKLWRDNKDWLLERCDWAAGFGKQEI